MKLTQLRNLRAVADAGSVRQASRDLNLSQSAITKSIQMFSIMTHHTNFDCIQDALRRAHRRPPFLCQSCRAARERGAEGEEEEEEEEEEGEGGEEDEEGEDDDDDSSFISIYTNSRSTASAARRCYYYYYDDDDDYYYYYYYYHYYHHHHYYYY